MKIELQRALVPEDFGREEPCAVCETPFRTESVIAYAKTDYGMSLADDSKYTSAICPECVEVLGAHRPDKFPHDRGVPHCLEALPRARMGERGGRGCC